MVNILTSIKYLKKKVLFDGQMSLDSPPQQIQSNVVFFTYL